MKKLLYLMAFVCTTCLILSCSSDDEGDKTGGSSDVIVGNWKYIGDIDEGGYEANDGEPCDDEFLKFNSNGTVKATYKYCGESTEVINFSWEKANEVNRYIITDEDDFSEDIKITFTDDKQEMTLYEYEDENGFYGIVYKRQ